MTNNLYNLDVQGVITSQATGHIMGSVVEMPAPSAENYKSTVLYLGDTTAQYTKNHIYHCDSAGGPPQWYDVTPSVGSPTWGEIEGSIYNQADLMYFLNKMVTTDQAQTIDGDKTFTGIVKVNDRLVLGPGAILNASSYSALKTKVNDTADAVLLKQDKLPTGTTVGTVLTVLDASGTLGWAPGGGGIVAWGTIQGDITAQTDLNNALVGERTERENADNALSAAINQKQNKLPNSAQAGYVLKALDTLGNVGWAPEGGITSVAFADITGQPTDNANLATALNGKVDLTSEQIITGEKTFNKINATRIDIGSLYIDETELMTIKTSISSLVTGKQDKLPNSAQAGYVLKATDTVGGIEWGPGGAVSVAFADIQGNATDNVSLAAELDGKVTANAPITGATYPKVTYDSKGLVTGGSILNANDIPTIPQHKVADLTDALNGKQPTLPNSAVVGYVLKATDTAGGLEWAPDEGVKFVQFADLQGNATDNASLAGQLNLKQDKLPNAASAGKVLKSTDNAGGVEWADGSVTVNWGDIQGDIINQSDLIAFIDGQIGDERTERQAQDAALSESIANEATARTGGDATLQSAINEVRSDLTAESVAREANDNNIIAALNTKANNEALSNEANTRAAEDTAIWTGINEEAAVRQNADDALSARIDGKQDTLTAGSGINISTGGVISCDIAIKVDATTYYDLGRAPTENDPGNENTFYLFNNVPLAGQVAEYLCEPKGTEPETYLWTYVGLASMSFVKDTVVQDTTNLVENQAVYHALLAKQNLLPDAGAAGKILKSTAVQGVVEWGDLPENGVQDVKVGGTSVVDADGVAEIDLSGLVDLASEQTITGEKTFTGEINATKINLGSKYVDETILTGIQTVLAQVPGKEDITNKVSAWQATPDDTHYPTEKLVKDTLNDLNSEIGGKVESSQIVTAWQTPTSDANIPSEKLVADTVSTVALQLNDKIDKTSMVTAWQATPANNAVPTEKLVKDSLDAKQNTLPVTDTAGKILKSTDVLGTVVWGDAPTATWGGITGRLGDQSDLMDLFATKAEGADLLTETEARTNADAALQTAIGGKQDALPNATAAGMVLKSTDDAGGIEWGDAPSTTVSWGDIQGELANQADLAEALATITDDITALETGLADHESASNPHGITKATIGLDNVDNTSDMAKPVSLAVQAALGGKVDKETGKGLSTNDYTTAEKEKLASLPSDAEANVIETVKVNGSPLAIADKAVDVPVPTALSELSADETHRLVADTEKAAWNAKQDALTFDTAPTAGSTNPVTSNGINAAIAAKADPYVAGFGIGIQGNTINATTNLKTNTDYYDLGREPTATDAGQIMTIYFIKNVPEPGATGQYVCEPQGTDPETYEWTCIGNTDVQILMDASVSTTSENGVQNQAITNYVNNVLAGKLDATLFNQHLAASNPHGITKLTLGLENVENKALSAFLPPSVGAADTPTYTDATGKLTAGTPLQAGAYKSMGSVAYGNDGLVTGGQIYDYAQDMAIVIKGTATVDKTKWMADTEDPNYGITNVVEITGIKDTDIVTVTFEPNQALSGHYAPYNNSQANGIKLYANANPTDNFTINYVAIRKLSEA